MAHFDLLVIGTGSGNSIVDDRFSHLKVAIAEEWLFGGTCLNVGCIPTKMLVYPAEVAHSSADSTHLNLQTSYNGVDWPGLSHRIFDRIDAIEADGRDYRTNRLENVTVFPERVHFTGRNSAQTASGDTFTFDRVVIATGSFPTPLEAAGLDWDRVDTESYPVKTSNSIMRIPALPCSLAIVGSGFIAVEFAHIFSSLGVEVTVLARGNRLLGNHDHDVSQAFTQQFSENVNVRFGVEVESVDTTDGVSLTLKETGRAEGADTSAVEADLMLVAVGRTRATHALNVDALGATTDGDRLVVDDYQRVVSSNGEPLDGVWALGDVCSEHLLKHVANAEARTVQHNILVDVGCETTPVSTDHSVIPAAVFSHPQIGSVGATEEQLRKEGVDFVSSTCEYGGVAFGWALNEPGFAKVLAHRTTRQILGAHVIGEQAASLVQLFVQAMAFNIPADKMARGQMWIHPALTEVVENALLGLVFGEDAR